MLNHWMLNLINISPKIILLYRRTEKYPKATISILIPFTGRQRLPFPNMFLLSGLDRSLTKIMNRKKETSEQENRT